VVAIAAHLLEADPHDLDVGGGAVHVRGTPTRSVGLADIAAAAYTNGALPATIGAGLEVVSRHESPLPFTLANACHMCACEVDAITGRVTVLRYVVSEDCGVMINPMVVDGQVLGGVTQGVAAALLERISYTEDGQPATTTLMDYLAPTAAELCPIEIVHLETPSAFSETGAKGMGEGGTIGAPAAVLNAINDALSGTAVSFDQIPVLPTDLHAALTTTGLARTGAP
jgi:carbon-monoxide dehydrogenase large subunit